MKRLFAALACLTLPLQAAASPALASQWGEQAEALYQDTTALIGEIDMGLTPEPSETYRLNILRFAQTAAGLAVWIDQSAGPKDLGCIFRGMSAEGEAQVEALDAPFDPISTRDAYRRLATMFSDAEMIALAAKRRSATPGLRPTETEVMSCPADPAAAMRALRY